jgi:hypothetical protein
MTLKVLWDNDGGNHVCGIKISKAGKKAMLRNTSEETMA